MAAYDKRNEKLQKPFERILGSEEVHFQAPPGIKMKYPAIRYELSRMTSRYANNEKYRNMTGYTITLITTDPDNTYLDRLLELPYCQFDRRYTADNLYHDVCTIFI